MSNKYNGGYKLVKCNKGRRVKVDGPQCGGLYKEDNESIFPWSGTDPGLGHQIPISLISTVCKKFDK